MGPIVSNAVEESTVAGRTAQLTSEPASQPTGFDLPRRPLAGLPRRSLAGLPASLGGGKHTFRGTENKPIRTISNRTSNDSRKLATHSESMTSKFLIATKMHASEEKAKSDEKAKPKVFSGG
jgi:hypothetical protein